MSIVSSIQQLGLSFALFLEREAGYELLSLLLILGGLLVLDPVSRAQTARDLISFALGVLARSMGGRSVREQQ